MTGAPRFLAAALGSVLAISTLALLPETAPAGPRAHASSQRFQQHLGLTDQQMTAIRDVHARHADQRRDTGKALHQAQAELREMALKSDDPAAVKAKSAQVAGLMAQAVEQRAAELQEISPLLTPEQRDKLSKMGGDRFHHRRAAPAERP